MTLPCPFCGGASESWERPCNNGPLYQTGCRSCGIRTTHQTAKLAAKNWDKRTKNMMRELEAKTHEALAKVEGKS